MYALRKLLFPFSILYGLITWIRNMCYDLGIFKSYKFEIPIISVGNLSVGGTGKTPQIEYLIKLVQPTKKVAVLSRGYQRKTKGFVLAKEGVSVGDIGDEPFQYYSKFNDIIVAVDENRVSGINKILNLKNLPDVILLDDAFQHRSVSPGVSILLTSFNNLFVNDFLLPVGNLRESKSGFKRADIIIVTNCPLTMDISKQQKIIHQLKPLATQEIYFSKVAYHNKLQGFCNNISVNDLQNYEVLLITGIANPKFLCNFLHEQKVTFTHVEFPDHHNFTKSEIEKIKFVFNNFKSDKKLILTTEKDYVRIFAFLEKCYFIAIETRIINNEDIFREKIKNYVG